MCISTLQWVRQILFHTKIVRSQDNQSVTDVLYRASNKSQRRGPVRVRWHTPVETGGGGGERPVNLLLHSLKKEQVVKTRSAKTNNWQKQALSILIMAESDHAFENQGTS